MSDFKEIFVDGYARTQMNVVLIDAVGEENAASPGFCIGYADAKRGDEEAATNIDRYYDGYDYFIKNRGAEK